MLKEYTVIIHGGDNKIPMDNFEYAIVMMEDYRNKYKNRLNLPKGTRYNWFPLVLLHQYRKLESSMNDKDVLQIRKFFRMCAENDKYFSFYLDKYKRQGNNIKICYKANEEMTHEIKTILKIYGLECKAQS